MREAIVGIDHKTRRCEFVAIDSPENWEECRAGGWIVVPTSKDKAREVWGKVVDDVYALATPNVEFRGATPVGGASPGTKS